jgi:hypothetical protein
VQHSLPLLEVAQKEQACERTHAEGLVLRGDISVYLSTGSDLAARFAGECRQADARWNLLIAGATAVIFPVICRFDRFEFFSNLTPLIYEIQIDHAKGRIRACEGAMMTVHRLLSTVFGAA